MNISWLEQFLALARARSFTKAAENLFITQPSLSRTIAELEAREGCLLFNRDSRPISLTQAGEVFYQWACIVERDLIEMDREMALARRGIFGSLHIGYYGEPQIRILNQGIEQLKRVQPNAQWRIHRGQPAQLEQMLMAGEINMTFLHLPHARILDWIEYQTVIRGGLCVLLPKDHPLSDRQSVRISEVVDEPYISFPRDVSPYGYDMEMRPFIDANAIPRTCAVVADIEELGIMVANGDGITLMSRPTAEALQGVGLGVRAIDLDGYGEGFDLVLAWRRNDSNPYIQIMRDAICLSKGV